ncbi:MAG: alpha-galactosidase [Clostridia bacterium]|nr:alpha-galactosidase [Clostridia bacterium]
MKNFVSGADMRLTGRLFRFTRPENLPISFVYGGQSIRGIPAAFAPVVETRRIDANLQQTVVRGCSADGLEIRVEYVEYLDYPATEFLAFFTNASDRNSAILSDVKILDGVLPFPGAQLVHGNGDTCREDGYDWQRDETDRALSLYTSDGTSCNGAFPYMRLAGKDCGVNIAVGWPAMWQADFAPAEGGVSVRIGQKRCHTVLHPGETMRTPRVNLVGYTGDETRGMNMWRRWYIAHILPRENGQPLPPKCCMHVFGAEGKPEFTGASEVNQLRGIEAYLKNGIRPDVWWIDAGWYPCDYDWPTIGTWKPDEARFPNGLAPIGRKCEENGMQLLLWFEPERVRPGTELDTDHPDWLLYLNKEDGSVAENRLLNLGSPDCCEWITDRIDSIIKSSGVKIYRQDFNFPPAPYWEQAEAEDRIGMIENLHVQGYLKLWDSLLFRNPGLWIDSCASGGRRNDLETMRRAVPLHYTDVGYGNHPIKLLQHRQMFEWIPYFRAHNMNWDDPVTGEYGNQGYPSDRFSYYAAMTPALTDMLEWDADESAYALAREMQSIWRKAAQRMLSCDFHPLTPCTKSQETFAAFLFHSPEEEKGFLYLLRHNRCPQESFCAKLPPMNPGLTYILTEAETGETLEYTGAQLIEGVRFELPVRSGRIYFYESKR